MIYLKKGMKDSALRTLSTVVKQEPDSALYHYHLAIALLENTDKRRARIELTEALKYDPNEEIGRKIKQALQRAE